VTRISASPRRLSSALVTGILLSVLVLTGCSSGTDSASNVPPQQRLAEAKQHFDAAHYIGFTLSTSRLPSGLRGLLSASGTGTHAPAFTGTVKVQTGVDITAPLVAVHNSVYAKLPFAGWSQLNPADYGAPDPAALMNKQSGLSSLFTATTRLRAGPSERQGSAVLSTISGILPGSALRGVFPSAGAGDFTVDYKLDGANIVVEATITGPFYAGLPDITYTIDLNLNAHAVDISAPL
jgi:lipoprotein LprG